MEFIELFLVSTPQLSWNFEAIGFFFLGRLAYSNERFPHSDFAEGRAIFLSNHHVVGVLDLGLLKVS